MIEAPKHLSPVELFSRQCQALIGDPTLGCPAITKALYRVEGNPLSEADLSDAANALLVNFGRDPLEATQLKQGMDRLAELDIVRTEPEGIMLTPTGSYLARVLSAPVGQPTV